MSTTWRDYMRDEEPSGAWRHARVTWWLIGINVGLWFLFAGSVSWSRGGSALHHFISDTLLLHPEEVIGRWRLWQPFTALWFHDPDGFGHILWNMIFLWFFGTHVEEMLGRRGFVSLYLRAGLLGTLLLLPLSLVLPGPITALGASGCVYGVAVFLACRRPRMQVIFIILRMPLWVLVFGFMVGLEVIRLVVLNQPAASVLGHLAGAAYGWFHHLWFADSAAARSPGPLGRLAERWRTARARRVAQGEAEVRERVERLLDKIARDGIGALSASEKDFLESASRRYPRS